MTPIIYTDFYKTEHFKMYPEDTTMIYSNMTPRKSRIKGFDSIVFFGLQHFLKKYILGKFQKEFFDKAWNLIDEEYKMDIHVDTNHIKKLWELGYMPLEIKALPEGTRCPIGVPCMTIRNTKPEHFWLTNYLETLLSCQLWQPTTSATIAAEFYKLLAKYAKETTGSTDFVQWQGHDFSMRGMSSLESAILSGMGHLTSFTGTDTIPAIYALRSSYNANGTLIGASVPATEHSVMCMGTKDDEMGTFIKLLDIYPTGILSVVSDTWDLWKVCTEYLPKLKEKILARDGKLVIRPDSGDPVDIICGWSEKRTNSKTLLSTPEGKGVIELLWDTFGGKTNEYGYKELDLHIGAIYGDSINLERAQQICERLMAKGFASTNIVFGIGSYTYQYNTRDTFGFAMKATYGELVEHDAIMTEQGHTVDYVEAREIYKDPVTDDGTKKSKKGLLRVYQDDTGKIVVADQQTWEEESEGLLKTVFLNGKITQEYSLEDIRKRIKSA
jgi:nicotinamide phosphoribosyltransferase